MLAEATDATNYTIGFGLVGLVVLGTALCWPAKRFQEARKVKRAAQTALIVAGLSPVGVALAAGTVPTSAHYYYAVALLATAGLGAAAIMGGRMLAAAPEDVMPATLQLQAGIVALFIAADVLRSGMALKLSPLSNLYLTGVRFYGMGNAVRRLSSARWSWRGCSRSKGPARNGCGLPRSSRWACGSWARARCWRGRRWGPTRTA